MPNPQNPQFDDAKHCMYEKTPSFSIKHPILPAVPESEWRLNLYHSLTAASHTFTLARTMIKNLFSDTELAKSLKAFSGSFKTVALFSAFINLLALTPSIYMMQIYDRVMVSRNETTLWMLTLMVAGIFLFIGALEAARTHLLVRVGVRFDMNLNQRIYNAVYEMKLKDGSAAASQALRDLTNLRQFLTSQGVLAICDLPWLPIYLIFVTLFHPLLGATAVVVAAISIWLAFMNASKTDTLLTDASKLAQKSGQMADVNLQNAETIEAMGMLGAIRSRWLTNHEAFLGLQAQASDQAGVWLNASKYFRAFAQSLALGLGAWLSLENLISPGMMIAASILMGRALSPVDQLVSAWKGMASARESYRRLESLLTGQPERKAGLPLPDPVPRLTTNNLHAGPPGAKQPTISQINLDIPAGAVVGIIGPSGAGKSTLLRVLAGIWRPLAGEVRLDGADLFQWDRQALGRFVGYLPQDIDIFPGTVAENIARFGTIDATQVVNAAKAAGIHDMILKLPKGYDTELGPGGQGLSGGQKQRLGMARALYGEPRLLYLDEPNAHLDDAGEAALRDTILAQKQRGHTVVFVTQRRSLVGTADLLMFMAEGRVQLWGPPAAVLEKLQGPRPVQGAPAQLSALPPRAGTP